MFSLFCIYVYLYIFIVTEVNLPDVVADSYNLEAVEKNVELG